MQELVLLILPSTCAVWKVRCSCDNWQYGTQKYSPLSANAADLNMHVAAGSYCVILFSCVLHVN